MFRVALAPGMGVNAFFTFTVAGPILGLNVEQALIATFFSGILYAIIAITPARHYIAKLLPKNMKLAIGAMIGIFLAYVGLADSGIIVSGAYSLGFLNRPGLTNNAAGLATATKLGNFADPFVIVALVTLALILILHFIKVKGSVIIAILVGVVLLAILKGAGVADANKAFALQKYNDFGRFGELSSGMWQSIGSSFGKGQFYIALFVFLYVDFFDTTGTLFSIGEQAHLNKDDKWLKDANLVDAGSTVLGSVLLTSTTTSYVESLVGVSQGARTGFSSIIVSLCFALGIAIWPILSPILPIEHMQDKVYAQGGSIMPITGPVLVLIGVMMISQLKFFEWNKIVDIPPLFVTLIFGTLGFSISTGIAAGIIIYYFVNLAALVVSQFKPDFHVLDETFQMSESGKQVENRNPDFKDRVVNPVMITLLLLSIIYFATMPLYY